MRICSYNFREKDSEEEFTIFFECDKDGKAINVPDNTNLEDGQYKYSGFTAKDISDESIERFIGNNGFVKLPSEYDITNLITGE
jgi:hypothetical protein